eukprot:SM002256S07396  [mRNA]  locus=s2256:967:1284:+ [translate_table: standard]
MHHDDDKQDDSFTAQVLSDHRLTHFCCGLVPASSSLFHPSLPACQCPNFAAGPCQAHYCPALLNKSLQFTGYDPPAAQPICSCPTLRQRTSTVSHSLLVSHCNTL